MIGALSIDGKNILGVFALVVYESAAAEELVRSPNLTHENVDSRHYATLNVTPSLGSSLTCTAPT